MDKADAGWYGLAAHGITYSLWLQMCLGRFYRPKARREVWQVPRLLRFSPNPAHTSCQGSSLPSWLSILLDFYLYASWVLEFSTFISQIAGPSMDFRKRRHSHQDWRIPYGSFRDWWYYFYFSSGRDLLLLKMGPLHLDWPPTVYYVWVWASSHTAPAALTVLLPYVLSLPFIFADLLVF